MRNCGVHLTHFTLNTFTDKLNISDSTAHLESDSIWGILRGLESFSQLLVTTDDHTVVRLNNKFWISVLHI